MNIRNIILNLKNRTLHFIYKIKQIIKKIVINIFNFTKENVQFEKVLNSIGKKPLIQLAISWLVSVIGIILNLLSKNKFPDFFTMWLLLYFILLITCISTARINIM